MKVVNKFISYLQWIDSYIFDQEQKRDKWEKGRMYLYKLMNYTEKCGDVYFDDTFVSYLRIVE